MATSKEFRLQSDVEIETTLGESGMSGTLWLLERIRSWKTFPLNIGLTGNSGAGKSSFINAIRGLSGDSPGAAKVDVVESTGEPTKYNDPVNPNIVYWDLPGVGTPEWPQESYFTRLPMHNYDFFVILSRDRFTENDLWLAKQISEHEKAFYFIRTMIDSTIEGDKKSHRKTFNEDAVISTIREDCRSNLEKSGLNGKHVYLISNFETAKFDFPSVLKILYEDFPALNRKTYDLAFKKDKDVLLRIKKESLEKRIPDIAWSAAWTSRWSLERLKGVTETSKVEEEVELYEEQFGTNETALCNLATNLGESVESLKKRLQYEENFQKGIKKRLNAYIEQENKTSKIFVGLTIVGLPFNVYYANKAVKCMLTDILQKTSDIADKICEELKEQM